jgi:hypothetical protein
MCSKYWQCSLSCELPFLQTLPFVISILLLHMIWHLLTATGFPPGGSGQ